jgi:hypothetical protein
MGLLQTLGLKSTNVEAQLAPAIMTTGYGAGVYSFNSGLSNFGVGMDRMTALTCPSVMRCRNLIAGVISSIDLELYKKSTGVKLESPLWLDQPDIRQWTHYYFTVLHIGALLHFTPTMAGHQALNGLLTLA